MSKTNKPANSGTKSKPEGGYKGRSFGSFEFEKATYHLKVKSFLLEGTKVTAEQVLEDKELQAKLVALTGADAEKVGAGVLQLEY